MQNDQRQSIAIAPRTAVPPRGGERLVPAHDQHPRASLIRPAGLQEAAAVHFRARRDREVEQPEQRDGGGIGNGANARRRSERVRPPAPTRSRALVQGPARGDSQPPRPGRRSRTKEAVISRPRTPGIIRARRANTSACRAPGGHSEAGQKPESVRVHRDNASSSTADWATCPRSARRSNRPGWSAARRARVCRSGRRCPARDRSDSGPRVGVRRPARPARPGARRRRLPAGWGGQDRAAREPPPAAAAGATALLPSP